MYSLDSLLTSGLAELINQADKIRNDYLGCSLEVCSIINAKSGLCAEDCKFCAQAKRYQTNITAYPLKHKREILEAARQAKQAGAVKFGIVSSGNKPTNKELPIIRETILEIQEQVGIDVCASLGALDKSQLQSLKEAGLKRYHHNIETSETFYPRIVSTHTFQERVDTIKAAKEVGLEVCSGGIIGMGETWQDRIDMALSLKALDVDSVPINFLVPIRGTPLENQEQISCSDAIRTIAIFRIILKDKIIKIAAGRETILKDFQGSGFMAGANGMLIGGYLTVKGRDVKEDHLLISEIKKLWKG